MLWKSVLGSGDQGSRDSRTAAALSTWAQWKQVKGSLLASFWRLYPCSAEQGEIYELQR